MSKHSTSSGTALVFLPRAMIGSLCSFLGLEESEDPSDSFGDCIAKQTLDWGYWLGVLYCTTGVVGVSQRDDVGRSALALFY